MERANTEEREHEKEEDSQDQEEMQRERDEVFVLRKCTKTWGQSIDKK